jgi:hypothetical protein
LRKKVLEQGAGAIHDVKMTEMLNDAIVFCADPSSAAPSIA